MAEELHFGRAAERVFVVQQALSSSIRNLEEEVGVQLVTRTTRRVQLTPAGQELQSVIQAIDGWARTHLTTPDPTPA